MAHSAMASFNEIKCSIYIGFFSWYKNPYMICLNLLSTSSWIISSVSPHGLFVCLFVSWQPIWNFCKLKFQISPSKQFEIIEGITNLLPAPGSGPSYQLIYFLKYWFPLKYSCPLTFFKWLNFFLLFGLQLKYQHYFPFIYLHFLFFQPLSCKY